MKKILSVIAVMMVLALVASGCQKEERKTGIQKPVARAAESVSKNISEKSLVEDFCSQKWNGSFIEEGEHCASIDETGNLWFDCKKSTKYIPDMGVNEHIFWCYPISRDATGTWIRNQELNTIELWSKGRRYVCLALNDSEFGSYYTSVYKLSSAIVARYGSHLGIYSLDAKSIDNIRDITDVYQSSDEIFCSNFEHKNFKITGKGEVEEIASNFVRFPIPRKAAPSDEKSEEDIALIKKIKVMYKPGEFWETARKIDGKLVAVNFYGEIVVNNKVIGSVNSEDELVENSKNFRDATVLWKDESVIVADYVGDGGYTLAKIDPDGTETIICDYCFDAYVAYDTIYYMTGNTVWSLDWTEAEAQPRPFFEGAIAVSHHADESEGAIVPQDQANYSGYGYDNLYSPYGNPYEE